MTPENGRAKQLDDGMGDTFVSVLQSLVHSTAAIHRKLCTSAFLSMKPMNIAVEPQNQIS
jgi:hypothetical protein